MTGPPCSAQINAIANVLRLDETIATELRIRANVYHSYKISHTDFENLVDSLIDNSTVKNLYISHYSLNTVVCSSLCTLITKRNGLERITFLHCKVTKEEATKLVKTLKSSENKLTSLVLNGKTFINQDMNSVTPGDFIQVECKPWECSRS